MDSLSSFKVETLPNDGNSISTIAQVFEVNYNHAVYNEIVQTRKLLESMHEKLDTVITTLVIKKKKVNKTN